MAYIQKGPEKQPKPQEATKDLQIAPAIRSLLK